MRDYIYNKTIKNKVPNKQKLENWLDQFYNWMFTNYNYDCFADFLNTEKALKSELENIISTVVSKEKAKYKTILFFNSIDSLYNLLESDLQKYNDSNLMIQFKSEVLSCYPGFLAVFIYRISHILVELNIPMLPRIASLYAYRLTGIDIDPHAKIGSQFIIFHGLGVVIGSTTIIGNNVKIYQGVILGESQTNLKQTQKRHPTIEDDVIIYANASVLGGKTRIGRQSIIGHNVVITSSIKEKSIVELTSSYSIRIKDELTK